MAKSKGMGFTGWCVRALLEGRKSQTMRIIRPQPYVGEGPHQPHAWHGTKWVTMRWFFEEDMRHELPSYAPYQPDDVVYVKEIWAPSDEGLLFRADTPEVDSEMVRDVTSDGRGWHSSRYMRRVDARMHRVIADVRAMRVGETTEAEALAEGVECYEGYMKQEPALVSLERAWDQLHDKDGDRFRDNPLVFRYKLEVSDEAVSLSG